MPVSSMASITRHNLRVVGVSSASTIAAGRLVGRPSRMSDVKNSMQASGAMIITNRNTGR